MICDVCNRMALGELYEIVKGPNGPVVFKQVLCKKCMTAAVEDARENDGALFTTREAALASI